MLSFYEALPHIIVIPRVLSAGVEKKATPPFVGWLSG